MRGFSCITKVRRNHPSAPGLIRSEKMKKYVLDENRKTFIFRQLEIIIAYVVVWAAVSLIYQVSDGGVSGISPFQIKINLYWFVIAAWLIT